MITFARLIHGCALDPESVDGIPGYAKASATDHSSPEFAGVQVMSPAITGNGEKV